MAFYFPVVTDYDPTLPVAVHPVGLPGYTERWIADLLPVGTLTAGWESITDRRALAVPAGGTAPEVKLADGFQYLEFRGGESVTASMTGLTVRAVTVIFRVPAGVPSGSAYIFIGGGVNMQATSTGAIRAVRIPTSANQDTAVVYTRQQWGIATVTIDNPQTGSRVAGNGVVSGAPGATPTGNVTAISLGFGAGVAFDIDIAEVIVHGGTTAPNAAALTTIYDTLRQQYGI